MEKAQFAHYLTAEQTEKLSKISQDISRASALIVTAMTDLMLLGVIDGRPHEKLSASEEAISGLGYMFSPQSEWMGNDKNGEPMFKSRKPHIFE